MAKHDKPTTIYLVHTDRDPQPYYYRDRAPAEQHFGLLRAHGERADLETLDLRVRAPNSRSLYRAEVRPGLPEAQWRAPRVKAIIAFEGDPLFRETLPTSVESGQWIFGYGRSEAEALDEVFGYCEFIGWHAYVAQWKEAS